MSLKKNKNTNITLKTYNNSIIKFKNNRNSNILNNNNTTSSNNTNNINLTAIEPIHNIYEIYHQKNRKNKIEYYENNHHSLNKIQKFRNKNNILTNISLNTTTTLNNNNNIHSSLPFIQTSTNSTFDFKTTTTNTSFNNTLKKKFIIPNTKKIIIENNKKSTDLNYIYFPDNKKINPNDYYYTSTFSFPDLMNKTKIDKNIFDKSLYEKLMYFDNLINTIKKRDIQTTGEYIINKTKFNNLNIKAPECVIHNVFLNLIVKDIFHKIEIRNEMNKFINYDYVVNLLNEEIYKYKQNILDLKNENENSSKTINTELTNDYLNYAIKKNKIINDNNNNNEDDFNYYYNFDDVDDDNFLSKNSLHSNILNINKFRLNKSKVKNFNEITKENYSNNETKQKQNNYNDDIKSIFNNNKLSNIFNKNLKKEDYAQTQYSNDSNYSKIRSKNFHNSQNNFYIKDKNGNLILISNDGDYKIINKNGKLYFLSSGKEILIDKNSSLISKDKNGNEIVISSDLNKNEDEINNLIKNNIIKEKNEDSNSSSYIEYINYDKDGKIIEKKRIKKAKKKTN